MGNCLTTGPLIGQLGSDIAESSARRFALPPHKIGEVVQRRYPAGSWGVVEAVYDDGNILMAVFCGPEARMAAVEYALARGFQPELVTKKSQIRRLFEIAASKCPLRKNHTPPSAKCIAV